MGSFAKALQDALKAKELNPQWPKVMMENCTFLPSHTRSLSLSRKHNINSYTHIAISGATTDVDERLRRLRAGLKKSPIEDFEREKERERGEREREACNRQLGSIYLTTTTTATETITVTTAAFIPSLFHFQAYYRVGVALQCLGRHPEALGAFANGLAQDPKSMQLLAGMVEAAMKSPLKGKK